MLHMAVPDIKAKIRQATGLSEEAVSKQINEKLSQLAGLISEEGAAHIVANELGVKLFDPANVKIKDLIPGMRSIDVNGKVLKKYELRQFKTGDREGQVANCLIGDETGNLRVVFWNKQADVFKTFNEGDIIRIVGGYVKENQGKAEAHLNDASRVIINPPGVAITATTAASSPSAKRKLIVQLQENEVADILATVVQVFDPKFYEICPSCNKRVKADTGFSCDTHGKIEPSYGYVLNCFLDDGSGNIRVVLFNEQARQFLNSSAEAVLALRDNQAAMAEVKQAVLGSIISVTGKVNKNAVFDRLEIVAFSVNAAPQPKEELLTIDALQPVNIPVRKEDDFSVLQQEFEEALDE